MHDAFCAALRTAINEAIAERSTNIAKGICSSLEDYKKSVGYIEALNDVLSLCDGIEKRLYHNPLKGQA